MHVTSSSRTANHDTTGRDRVGQDDGTGLGVFYGFSAERYGRRAKQT